MKMSILTILFTLLSLRLTAPPDTRLVITEGEAVNPYEAIWNAVCEVESGFNPLAYNPSEKAYGIAQIRDIRLKDYNTRTGKNVSLIACYDVKTAKSIFMFYVSQYSPNDILGMCRDWNGKSKRNLYYKKIVKVL